jgi:hypothetical protein
MRSRLPGLVSILLLIALLFFASKSWAQDTSSSTPQNENAPPPKNELALDKPQSDCKETAPVAMLDQWNRLMVEYFDAHTGSVCRETSVMDGQFVAAAFDSSSEILFGVRGSDANLVAYSLANGDVKTLDEAPIDILAGELVLDAAHHWIIIGALQFFYDEQGRLYRMADQSPVEMIKS